MVRGGGEQARTGKDGTQEREVAGRRVEWGSGGRRRSAATGGLSCLMGNVHRARREAREECQEAAPTEHRKVGVKRAGRV